MYTISQLFYGSLALSGFSDPLQRYGPWFYPRLYWEADMIGQLLYLEAEAAGIRSTGIAVSLMPRCMRCWG